MSPADERSEPSSTDPPVAETGGPWHLFEAFGVELEWMIVDRETLSVAPIADRLLEAVAGEVVSEVEVGDLAWSNELVLHVVETKTATPAPRLEDLPGHFQDAARRIDALLEPLGARLLPGAMHPWFDPATETRLWPHEHGPVYRTFDRVFGCRGHGWSNLQSAHLNLPFAGDEEFGRLHAAIRLLLPLLPTLAASSPVVDGAPSGLLDTRLEVYRTNARRLETAGPDPVTGRVIPEPVFDRAGYERDIFAPLRRAIAPHDPEGVLEMEFLNARGAIARFSRGSIEIRVLDVQEHPRADLAVLAATVAVLRCLVEGRWGDPARQREWPVAPLADLFEHALIRGEETPIEDPRYLAVFGWTGPTEGVTAGRLWRHLVEEGFASGHLAPAWREPLDVILDHGPLARRLLADLGPTPDRAHLQATWTRLARCLVEGRPFLPEG